MKKILFTGFMASILMASGAYAEVTAASLTTKGYVDAAAKWARDAAMDYTYDVVGEIGADDVATSIANALTEAEGYTDEAIGEINATDVATAINNAADAAQTYIDDAIGDLGESDSVVEYVNAAIESTGGDVTELAERVTTIEQSDAYTSGIDSTKVAQIATNADAIDDLEAKFACSDTACVLNGSGTFVPVDTAISFTEGGMEPDPEPVVE